MPTGNLYYIPFRRAFAPNGYVIPGALSYFYLSGTLTETPVYADADLTTPLENPVVANAGGKFPDIYMDPEVVYRNIITDADGEVLDDTDPLIQNGEGGEGGLRNTVYPEDFSSYDAENQTPAVLEAFASGANVLGVPGTTYTVNENVEFSANGQALEGGVWNFVGDCGFVVPEGVFGVKIQNLAISAPDHTGTGIKITGGDRVWIENVNMLNVYSCFYIESANTVTINSCWAQARGKGITWYGDDDKRSDILNIYNTTIGLGGAGQAVDTITHVGAVATVTTDAAHGLTTGDKVTFTGTAPSEYNVTNATVTVLTSTTFTYTIGGTPATNATDVGSYVYNYNQYGLDWDGNCHTLDIVNMRIVRGLGGIVRNTSGGATLPAIGRFVNYQSDYSGSHGLFFSAALIQDQDLIGCYILGSNGDGLRVAASIDTGNIRVTGGKFRGCTGYGINNLGGPLYYAGNADLSDNDSGEKNGNVWTEPFDLRFGDGTRAINTDGSGNIQIIGDANDYQTYDGAANIWRFYVGAEQRAAITAQGVGVNFTPTDGYSFAVTNPSGNCEGTISNGGAGSGAITATGAGNLWTMFRVGGNYVKAGGEQKKVLSIGTSSTMVTEAFTGALSNATFESIPHNTANPHWWITEGGCLVGPETSIEQDIQCAVMYYLETPTIANGTEPIVGSVFLRRQRPTVTGSASLTRFVDNIDMQPARTTAGVFSGGTQYINFGVGPSNTVDWTAPVVPYLIPSCQSLNLHSTTGHAALTFPKMALTVGSIDHNSGIYSQVFGRVTVNQQVTTGQGQIDFYADTMFYFRNGGGTTGATKVCAVGMDTTLWGEPSTSKFLWNNTTTESYLGGALEVAGRTTFGAALNKKAYTVATLPGAPTTGDEARVTDANAPTFGSTVAGGGAAHVPVFYNGTNWIVA